MTNLRQSFLIFGIPYQVVGEPCEARLIRLPEGISVHYYGKAWTPREVIADATHDARVLTGRVRSPLTTLVTALLLMVAVTSGAWAKGRTDPPREKPGPAIPVSAPAEHDVQASWAWWIAWAGYLEVGPFASAQACEQARIRFPVRYRCVPIRD